MRRFEPQDATGVIIRKAPIGVMYIIQPTTPTNGQAGFGHGCVWINTAGGSAGAGTTFYVNTGSNTSSTWTAITAL